jgi:hypothetical protein
MHASLKSVVFALSLLGAMGASQASVRVQDLQGLTSSGTAFTNAFTTAQAFTDYYTFTLDQGSSGVTGRTVDSSYLALVSRDVQLQSVSLMDWVTNELVGSADTSPGQFSFNGLLSGHEYALMFKGSALAGARLTEGRTSGNYSATVQAVASSAPEASDLAMSLMGLGAVGWMCRRSKRVI